MRANACECTNPYHCGALEEIRGSTEEKAEGAVGAALVCRAFATSSPRQIGQHWYAPFAKQPCDTSSM